MVMELRHDGGRKGIPDGGGEPRRAQKGDEKMTIIMIGIGGR